MIPVPCRFGEPANIKDKMLPLKGVTWFKWTDGMEFTYYFDNDDKWHNTHFKCIMMPDFKEHYNIRDNLLINDFLKNKGYPVRGRGYAFGIALIEQHFCIEIILTDLYMAHIYLQCNEQGEYIENGNIYVPASWDTSDKKESILLSPYIGKVQVLNR